MSDFSVLKSFLFKVVLPGTYPILTLKATSQRKVSMYISSLFPPFYYQGAQFLTELAPLCKIYCSDGEEYTISR